ncbi:hypothetical protein [Streptomyces sp. TRM68416]|uniref:hypothetical protein n=1 Tax=Streptomyces sp. TRM68416 TaxID=2758412 RepID=UPI001661F295|nr:hypothetical protein [Streptomyces sp. TRM68416]MBD0843396.1 hypothetical protein [Streptomyces sp. TRM68416]
MPPDPEAGFARDGVLPDRAERELAALLATEDPKPRSPKGMPRRSILLAGGAVASATAVAASGEVGRLLGASGGEAAAATTQPVLVLRRIAGRSSHDVLTELADKVGKLAPETVQGPYLYTKSWGWWLNSAGDVPGGVANAAVPTVTEQWIRTSDGSGRERRRYGRPYFPNPDQERDAREAALIEGKGVEDKTYGTGHFTPYPEWQQLIPFSTDPDRLLAQMKQVNWEAGRLIYGVSAMLNAAQLTSGVVAPELRAAALRVLAKCTDVTVTTTTTWQGQQALAVTQEGRHKNATFRDSLLIDPTDGYPMGHEDALLGDPLALNIAVPGTLSVNETLARGTVKDTRSRI